MLRGTDNKHSSKKKHHSCINAISYRSIKFTVSNENCAGENGAACDPQELPAIRFVKIKNIRLRFIIRGSKNRHPPDQHQHGEEQDEYPVNALVDSALSLVAHG